MSNVRVLTRNSGSGTLSTASWSMPNPNDKCQCTRRSNLRMRVPVLLGSSKLPRNHHIASVVRRLILLQAIGMIVLQAGPKPTPPSPNLLKCLKGLAGCDVSALNPSELKQVSDSAKKRNMDYCMSGSTLCDPT